MKVAFGTRDGVHINTHFGSAKKMDIYDVSQEGYNFLNTIEFGGNLKQDGNEDKLVPKIEALEGCKIVYIAAIGGSAASRLMKHKVTPLKVQSEEDEIETILEDLVKTLNGTPPLWLRKIIGQTSKSFDFEDDD